MLDSARLPLLPRLALRMCFSLRTMYIEHCEGRQEARRRRKNEKVNVFDARKSESEVTTAIPDLPDPFSLPVSLSIYAFRTMMTSTLPERNERVSFLLSFSSWLFLSSLNFVTLHKQQPSAVEVTLSFTPSLYSLQRQDGKKKASKNSVITNSGTRETTNKKKYKLQLCVQSI